MTVLSACVLRRDSDWLDNNYYTCHVWLFGVDSLVEGQNETGTVCMVSLFTMYGHLIWQGRQNRVHAWGRQKRTVSYIECISVVLSQFIVPLYSLQVCSMATTEGPAH